MKVYDIIVVGAGPAGSATARAASNAGLEVLILEKETFPRYKPCGGALSDRAISLLDFPLPERLCERTITGIRVHFYDKVVEGHQKYRLSTLVSRSKFDQFCLQKAQEAGANLITQKVMNFKESNDHVKILTKKEAYKSRFLVISSGYQDNLKDHVRERDTRDECGLSIVTEIEEDDEKIEDRLHDSLEFYFDAVDAGYGWIFPHKGYYSIGIWGQASRLKDLRSKMIHFLIRNGFQGNYSLHGHKAPLGGSSRRIARSRVLLAGDSAGFVDPFNGEGIYYALRSGQIAAHAILEQDAADVSRAYIDMCKKNFDEELRYARWVSKSLAIHPETLTRVLTCSGQVLDKYIEIPAGKGTYKNFVGWLVPIVIQEYIGNCNQRIDKLPIILRGLLGKERINIKIILDSGGVLRLGCETERAQVKKIVEAGLPNPTLSLVLTERAISQIISSNDPIAAFQKECELGRLAMRGNDLGTRVKLDVALFSIVLLRIISQYFVPHCRPQ
jgi:geranylgeranyl reductase family protein